MTESNVYNLIDEEKYMQDTKIGYNWMVRTNVLYVI